MNFNSDLIDEYKKFSYGLLSQKVERYMTYFESLIIDMKKAGMRMSLLEYMSTAIMTSIVVFLVEFPLVFVISLFIPNFSLIMAFIFSFSITIVFSVGIFFFFYMYPSISAAGRKKSIDFALPFTTLYMATVSGGNAPAKAMFKILSKFTEYGEVTKEAKEITRNVEIFGMGINEAIRKSADKSPSEEFKELMWGIDTTLTTGGDLSEYLHGKARAFIQNYKRMMREYAKRVSVLLEVYVTLIVVGSIFFVVVSSLMSAFGTGMMDIIVIAQFFLIFLGLPVISIVFIIILKYMSPRVG
ncbi:MAG: type II secretion system F family protein [archaeon]|nr:MAG: type II secretion system F family protein [archaeon]